MVMNREEDGTSLPLLALENFLLFLMYISNQGANLTNFLDVIVSVKILVHETSMMQTRSSSEFINADQRYFLFLMNQIVVYSSKDAVKAEAREIMTVINFAEIDGKIVKQSF